MQFNHNFVYSILLMLLLLLVEFAKVIVNVLLLLLLYAKSPQFFLIYYCLLHYYLHFFRFSFLFLRVPKQTRCCCCCYSNQLPTTLLSLVALCHRRLPLFATPLTPSSTFLLTSRRHPSLSTLHRSVKLTLKRFALLKSHRLSHCWRLH